MRTGSRASNSRNGFFVSSAPKTGQDNHALSALERNANLTSKVVLRGGVMETGRITLTDSVAKLPAGALVKKVRK